MRTKPHMPSELQTGKTCPVSGLPIIRKPEWTEVVLGENYQVTFSLLGDRIILSQKSGYGTPASTDKFFTLLHDVISARKNPDRSFILIEDYTHFKGATFEARKRYIYRIKDQPVDALILFGASPFFKMSFKLGKRLYAPRKNLLLANSYSEAVRRARQQLQRDKIQSVELSSAQPVAPEQLSKHFITSHPDWRLDLEGYTAKFEVIDRNILHSVSSGYLQVEHIAHIASLRARVRREMDLTDGFECIIAGVKQMKGASRRARKRYTDSLKEWHARYPCQLYIFYGVNRFIRTAFNLARPIMPFKGRIAKDFRDALKIATAETTLHPKPSSESDDESSAEPAQNLIATQGYVDELLQYLGGIDWQREGIQFNREVSDSHPFRSVFDAIALIKGELEGLLTERDKATEALKKSEERYHDIFENVSDFLYFHDMKGYFKEANRAWKEMLGISDNELTAINSKDLIPRRYRHLFYDYLKRIQTNGHDHGLMRITVQTGQERILEYKNSLVYGSAEPIGVRGSARDITERIRTEKALKVSEEKYRTILQSIEEGYFEVDLKGNFTFFNDKLCNFLGYSRDELAGMNYHHIMDANDAQKISRIFSNIFQTGVSTKRVDWKVNNKSGIKAIVETSISLIKDSKAQAIGFRGIARDLTEQKRVEAEKKRLEAKLQQAQKMEAIGTLAGGVAHDLNNILSGIVSYPELLLMDIPENSPLKAPLSTIKQSGEKAATIVQDLLTLARRGVSINEIASLNHIIADYLDSPEFEKLRFYHPNISIETRYDEKLLNILCSPVHLSKTVMNLISNAAEAMTDGGQIVLSTENRYIDQPISGYDDVEEGDYVVLTVSDSGIGISPADQKRIFEPFYTKKVMGRSGTGLGMAVVWGTVKDHKGYIDVESVEGQGATFTLYFPAQRAELTRCESRVPLEDFKGKGESVLVVDDVKEQRDIATLMLKKLGYSVTTVSSGEEAVEYLRDNSADLLVLDMIMDPGMDGFETYKRVLQVRPGQKAIIASGFSESERVKQAQRLGAGVYVKKPYLLEKIGAAVRTELDL